MSLGCCPQGGFCLPVRGLGAVWGQGGRRLLPRAWWAPSFVPSPPVLGGSTRRGRVNPAGKRPRMHGSPWARGWERWGGQGGHWPLPHLPRVPSPHLIPLGGDSPPCCHPGTFNVPPPWASGAGWAPGNPTGRWGWYESSARGILKPCHREASGAGWTRGQRASHFALLP